MEFAQYSEDDKEELVSMLAEVCQKTIGPYGEMRNADASQDQPVEQVQQRRKKRPFGQRSQHDIVRDMFLALTLCHNVTPVYPDENDRSVKDYQASSPDEIALVKFSEEMGMHLVEREEEYIKLITPMGDEDEYDIL